MNQPQPPIVVYHVATMGNWQTVVREQMLGFREAGLLEIRLTHVGTSLDWVLEEAARHDVKVTVVRSDPNTDHYETFAMWEIERLAKAEQVTQPILYCHTKGVSAPNDHGKAYWRQVMSYHVIHKWRENLGHLLHTHDAVGWTFWFTRGRNHFSGNFWIANPDWIRKLPAFTAWHNERNRERFSCESWIGTTPGCRALSHGCNDVVCWEQSFDWTPHLPTDLGERHPTITWVTAATPLYLDDLTRLAQSFALLGAGHKLVSQVLENRGAWRHTIKLDILRRLIHTVDTSHLFWIDADCEFLTTIRPSDLIEPTKPLSAVRHFCSSGVMHWLPSALKLKVTWEPGEVSWQGCLFGGSVASMGQLLEALRWMDREGVGYDEHGLVIELDRIRDRVHTLPCRYAAPSSFAPFRETRGSYEQRAGGSPRIFHHNRESHRR